MHEVLVNRLGDLSLPRKSVVRLTDHPDMTLDVYRGRKTTMQQQCNSRVGRLRVTGVWIGAVLEQHMFRMKLYEEIRNLQPKMTIIRIP